MNEYQDKYLKKYGTKISFNLLPQQNQKMILDAYNNIEQDWYGKILCLTHRKINDKKFISSFEEIGTNEKNIVDMISDEEEYFFTSKMAHFNINNELVIWILRNSIYLRKNLFLKVNKVIKRMY